MSYRPWCIALCLLLQVACGSTTEDPDAGTSAPACTGCRDSKTLECRSGEEKSACGVQGDYCTNCVAYAKVCGPERKCVTPPSTPPDAGTGNTDGGSPDAGPPPPVYGCGAIPLQFTDGKAQVSGTTVGVASKLAGGCGGVDSGEVVYAFTLPQSTHNPHLLITVTPKDAAFQPLVYFRKDTCTDAKADQTCLSAHQPGASVQIQQYLSYQAATYYVVVDGLTSTGGAFDLSVEVDKNTGDNCADLLPLPGQTFTIQGSYQFADGATQSSCGDKGESDRIYRFQTTEPLYFNVRIEENSFGFRSSSLSLLDNCGSPDTVCGAKELKNVSLAPGTHYLRTGRYINPSDYYYYYLRGELVPPLPGDTCPKARPLTFTASGTSRVATDTFDSTGLHDDGDWHCDNANNRDFVYSFTTDKVWNLTANATDAKGYGRDVSVVGKDCTKASSLGCGSALSLTKLPAGQYFLWVDGLAEDSGQVKLSVTLKP